MQNKKQQTGQKVVKHTHDSKEELISSPSKEAVNLDSGSSEYSQSSPPKKRDVKTKDKLLVPNKAAVFAK